MSTWKVIEAGMKWDKATRKWVRKPERVIAQGLSQPEADAILARYARRGNLDVAAVPE